MTLLPFTKMHGIGNDFVVIDFVTQSGVLRPETIRYLADRHTGIGFDQLLLIEPPQSPDADFFYRIFNADGTESSQCGNGARCVGKYIFDKRLSVKTTLTLQTRVGRMITRRLSSAQFEVQLEPPALDPKAAGYHSVIGSEPPFAAGFDPAFEWSFGIVDLGNPHAVLICDHLDTLDVSALAQQFCDNHIFESGVNVGFMSVVSPTIIDLRVVERGAGETLACGSGACAAVIIGRQFAGLDQTVTVRLPGGELTITWSGPGSEVLMAGPAERIFEGRIKVPRTMEQ